MSKPKKTVSQPEIEFFPLVPFAQPTEMYIRALEQTLNFLYTAAHITELTPWNKPIVLRAWSDVKKCIWLAYQGETVKSTAIDLGYNHTFNSYVSHGLTNFIISIQDYFTIDVVPHLIDDVESFLNAK